MRQQIVITPEGTVKYVGDSGVKLTGSIVSTQSKERASIIEPVRLIPRLVFRFVRHCVSDDSRAAQWTRHWACKWRVRIIGGPVFGCFRDRDEAIRREVDWLQANRL